MLIVLWAWSLIEYFLPLHDTAASFLPSISPAKNPATTTRPPIGDRVEYFGLMFSALVDSIMAAAYIRADAIADITKSTPDEIPPSNTITEYPKIGNGMNSKNNTAKKIPIAMTLS